MINVQEATSNLRRQYPALEHISDGVFRGTDTYNGEVYAVRYFDLRDDLVSAAANIRDYQDRLLGTTYFEAEAKTDLRWNHYLYFVTSLPQGGDAYSKAKGAVERDREYARKIVLTESELITAFSGKPAAHSTKELPPDPLSIWTDILNSHQLGFVIDGSMQPPEVVRQIAGGEPRPFYRTLGTANLDHAEREAAADFLIKLNIKQFRTFPRVKEYDFGLVNLIVGVNGVGKTSLLEAIEFLYCGKTKRTPTVPKGVSVAGTLAKSGLTFETKGTTPPNNLRARHLAWYGKTELKTLTLHDSFSKFNFLDTDAAVRLTVEKSHERLSEDLFQLLLGAEASKTLDRFQRVTRHLEEEGKKCESDIAMKEFRRAQAATRAEQLRQAPRDSDQLFKELVRSLEKIGWRQLPKEKNGLESLAESLQSLLQSLSILKSVAREVPRSVPEIDSLLKALKVAKQRVDSAIEAEKAQGLEERHLRSSLDALNRRLELLTRLAPILSAGVRELQRRHDELAHQIATLDSKLADIESAVSSFIPDDQLAKTKLAAAIQGSVARKEEAENNARAAQQAVRDLERAQTLIATMKQRLRTGAEELMKHTGDPNHCPLCRAQYAEGELVLRLQSLVTDTISEESSRVRSELTLADEISQKASAEHSALKALERFVVDNPKADTVSSRLRQLKAQRTHLLTLQDELQSTQKALAAQYNKGWTMALIGELSAGIGIDADAISVDDLGVLQSELRTQQKELLDRAAKLTTVQSESQSVLAELASQYDFAVSTLVELARAISQRARSLTDCRKSIDDLELRLKLGDVQSEAVLEAQLRELQTLLIRLGTANARERADSEALVQELRTVEEAGAEVAGLRVKRKRLEAAESVIKNLLSQQSEQILAERVLKENAGTIASTFAKIHAPNEFDLTVDEGLRISRRGGGGNVELEQMSSGQRAAYALSLFLAMNERLTAGPRVIMLDDPVAHVDDINTLSLLDHLREIALAGQRQIFFATADSKLAGLFVRKFRFLGDQFKQLELTRS